MLFLSPLSLIYGAAIRLRNGYYDRVASPFRASVPVISVGNLSTGGTGKTPVCLFLFDLLKSRGLRPAIALRGYSKSGSFSDEAELYSLHCGKEAVFTGAKRSQSLKRIEAGDFNAAILDDAFQHRAVRRDFDLVLVDATRLPTEDRLLPAGSLRESIDNLRRAQGLVLSRCEQAEEGKVAAFEQYAAKRWPGLPLFRSRMRVKGYSGQFDQAEDPSGRPLLLVCGIGNPESFLRMAIQEKLQVTGSIFFPDHHQFTEADYREVLGLAEKHGASSVLITAKDATRWRPQQGLPAVVMHIRLELQQEKGKVSLEDLILRSITK